MVKNRKCKCLGLFSVGLLLLTAFLVPSSEAAFLENVPITLIQPNGEKVQSFVTGDEYYRRVHDGAGYTIVKDPDTGHFVYALKEKGVLVPSKLVVGQTLPGQMEMLGIAPDMTADPGKIPPPDQMLAPAPEVVNAPSTGTINNIVVFIRFSGESEFGETISGYNSMFNSTTAGANSMRNYFAEASYNQLTISSTFYPTPGTYVVSWQDSYPRNYYQVYDSVTNPDGYNGDAERTAREHALLKNAVEGVSSQIPTGLNVDGDSDGYVDNVCFIVRGGPDGWSDLLWPHRWALYSETALINGKRVFDYNFQLQDSLAGSGVGVLCHEMYHSLGAPDLYHYSGDGLNPVWSWGLMAYNSNPPRHMLAYMKHRYGGWISAIPEITTSGTYSLNPLSSSSTNCYKVASPNSASEYFVVEYRKSTTTFENSLPGQGLLVYRIDTTEDGLGNRNGPPDEVYIYRPGGTTSTDGTPSWANFAQDHGRTVINDTSDPSSFLQNGDPGGLDISSIGSVGSTLSFYVDVGGSGGNTPPEITDQVDLATTMETPLEITLSDLTVTDPDNVYPDDFTLFVMDGPDYARTGNTITPYPGFLGDLAVPVYVNDGTDDSNTYTLTVSVYTTLDPDLRVEPGTMPHVTVDYGMQDINTLTLYNDGGTELNFEVPYSLEQSEQTAAVKSSFSQSIPYMEIAKGQEDPRVGSKVTMGMGGPDAHGYIWVDSDEAGGPVFDWIDISSTGTLVTGLTDDSVVGPFPIGFDFPFYGENQTEFYVQSNGLIAFELIGSNLSNQTIPTIGDGVQNMIAWMWDDMHPMNGSVYYQIVDGVLVIQFDDYGQCCTAGPTVDAEILLYPNGDIKVQYLNFLNEIDTEGCTVGIENADGTDGLEVAFNTPYLHDGLAVLFAPDAVTWLTASPKSGAIPPGGSQTILMTYNESSMDAGSYAADIVITSDDPVDPEVLVPATMDVLAPPVMVVSPDSLEPMYLEPGHTVSKYLTISNEGSESTMEVGVRLSDISMIETSEPARLIPATSKSASTAQQPVSYAGKASYADTPKTEGVKSTDAPDVHRLSNDISGVPVLYISTYEEGETQFIGGLSDLNTIGTLDIVDGRTVTPNLTFLLDYDVVMVSSWFSFADPALLADTLADYVDSDGKVILFPGTFFEGGDWALDGRISQPGYSPFPITFFSSYPMAESDSLEDHYITTGIETVSSEWAANVFSPQGNGQSLGVFESGELIGAVNGDESVVAINVVPVDGSWAGDLIELTDNAIGFMTEPWLGINPSYAIVPPGESVEIELRYSSVLLDEGLYSGRLVVTSNDPDNSPVEMSVFLGIYEFLDMDRDGLSDGWEMYYFGDLSQDGSGDFDGDGMTNAEEYEYGSDPTDIISFPQAEGILADFGGEPYYGLWTLDQSGWHSLNTNPFADATPADPFMMIAHDFDQDGRDEIATGIASGSTGGPGLYTWDDNAWTQDFTAVPENMVLFGNNLATDFGPDPFYGLWVYSGGGNWTNLNVDPFDAATNPADATLMEGADFDGDGQEELAMGISAGSFGGPGLYIWDENAWTLHFSIEPLTMMAFGNSLLTNYGGGDFFGLWRYDSTGWTNLNTTPFSDTSVANPDQFVAVDLDRDGEDELVASFPTGTTGGPGIYTWDDGWTQIFSVAAVDMIPLNDSVVFDFGPGAYYGIWRYSQSTGWTSLNTAPFTDIDPAVSSIMGSADLDRDGYAELVIGITDGSTGGPGIYTWDGSWTLDLSIEPEDLESCFYLLNAP